MARRVSEAEANGGKAAGWKVAALGTKAHHLKLAS